MIEDKSKQKVDYDRSSGGLVRTESQSSIPIKVVYSPEDVRDIKYERDLNDPGNYPYTRGIYPEMYRKLLWIRSASVGYTTPEDTNKAYKEAIAAGLVGLRGPVDLPTQTGIDPDHPSAFSSMLCGGPSVYSLFPYEKLYCSFHGGLENDEHTSKKEASIRATIKSEAMNLGYEIVNAAYDLSNIEFYKECDLHVGYRLHGHIYFLYIILGHLLDKVI